MSLVWRIGWVCWPTVDEGKKIPCRHMQRPSRPARRRMVLLLLLLICSPAQDRT